MTLHKKVLKDLNTLLGEKVLRWCGACTVSSVTSGGKRTTFHSDTISQCAGLEPFAVFAKLKEIIGEDLFDVDRWNSILHGRFWEKVPVPASALNQAFLSGAWLYGQPVRKPDHNIIADNLGPAPDPEEIPERTEGDEMLDFFKTSTKDWAGDPQW